MINIHIILTTKLKLQVDTTSPDSASNSSQILSVAQSQLYEWDRQNVIITGRFLLVGLEGLLRNIMYCMSRKNLEIRIKKIAKKHDSRG